MRSMTRLGMLGVVGCLFVTWTAETERDVVVAQERKPVTYTRMFTGPDGLTHVEDVTVDMGPGSSQSEPFEDTGVRFWRRPSDFFADWHPAPRRQLVITLSGRGEVVIENGRVYEYGPGHVMLAEDLTGKGHVSRGAGTEDRVALIIPLGDPPAR